MGRVPVSGTVCRKLGRPQGLTERQPVAQERPELSVPEVRPVVFDQEHYAATHEPRVWRGEEDPVYNLSEAIPEKMESGAAHKAVASGMIGSRRRRGGGRGMRCQRTINLSLMSL